VDLHVARQVTAGRGARLEFTIDAFNLFNRTTTQA
jgi:hypothetical protein